MARAEALSGMRQTGVDVLDIHAVGIETIPEGQGGALIDLADPKATPAIQLVHNASTSANTGSTFMIAELPTTPSLGSTVNMMVKAGP